MEDFDPRRVLLLEPQGPHDSDADNTLTLIVILNNNAPESDLTWLACMDAQRGYEGTVDVITVRDGMYRSNLAIARSLAHHAENHGVLLFEKASVEKGLPSQQYEGPLLTQWPTMEDGFAVLQ